MWLKSTKNTKKHGDRFRLVIRRDDDRAAIATSAISGASTGRAA
jgi:hypothetical protein